MRAAPIMLLVSLMPGSNLNVCAQETRDKDLAAESARFRSLMRNSPGLS